MYLKPLLKPLKTRLSLSVSDTAKDAFLLACLEEAQSSFKAYLNRPSVPKELKQQLVSYARDIAVTRTTDNSLRLTVSETQGARSVKYKADTREAGDLLSPYKKELNRYRRIKF